MKSILRKVVRKLGLHEYNYWENQRYLEESEFKYILWLDRVYNKITTVPGHIVELGVAYGRNGIIFSHFNKMYNASDVRKYIGFDTFNGYSELSLNNSSRLSSSAWNNISKKAVLNRFRKAGITKGVTLVEGDILKTVNEYTNSNPDLRIALLYIDCNAYEPAIHGMDSLKDFMSPGGIICIDEKNQGGETKALIEFCEKNGYKFLRDNSTFSIPAYTVVNKL